MRRHVVVVIVASLGAMVNIPARAQRPSEMDGLRIGNFPHPMSAAITYWDTLGLTEIQVQALRALQARVGEVLFTRFQAELADTSVLFRFWRSGPVDSAALVREALANIGTQTHLQLELLRARDETFRILSAAQRMKLDSLVVRKFTHPERPLLNGCARGSSGGGISLSDRVEIVYSVDFQGDSARIEAVTIAKADSSLSNVPGRSRVVSRPQRRGGGGTVGGWWVLYDSDTDAVWIDTMQVRLNGRNVVLLQHVDRARQMPEVAGVTSIPAFVRTNGCRETEFTEMLRTHVLASPEIRAFIRRR